MFSGIVLHARRSEDERGQDFLRISQGYSIYMEGAQGDAVAYWRFPTHPGTQSGVVKKSHRLRDLIRAYNGPDLIVDFNESNTIIGIELVE